MFELPTVLAYPLFYKLVVPDESLVTREAMAAWVQSVGLLTLDPHTRMMEVLAQKGASAVTQVALLPFTLPFHLFCRNLGYLAASRTVVIPEGRLRRH